MAHLPHCTCKDYCVVLDPTGEACGTVIGKGSSSADDDAMAVLTTMMRTRMMIKMMVRLIAGAAARARACASAAARCG